MYPRLDPDYNRPAGTTFARTIQHEFPAPAAPAAPAPAQRPAAGAQPPAPAAAPAQQPEPGPVVLEGESPDAEPHDNLAAMRATCIAALQNAADLLAKIRGPGAAWGSIKALFVQVLPKNVDDRDGLAYRMVATAMDSVFGPQDTAWHSFKNPERENKTYVKTGPNPNPR
jgi:hypothetical protein